MADVKVKMVSWVREIAWCNTHDVPWATYDLLLHPADCVRGVRWVEDVEKLEKLGPPRREDGLEL